MKKAVFVLLIVVLLGIMGFSAWQILNITTEYQGGTQTYDELEQFVVIPETAPTEAATEETQADEPAEPQILWPQVDFAALAEVNPDVVGWIYIPDTQINYPVVQGKDNDYYLNHLFNKKAYLLRQTLLPTLDQPHLQPWFSILQDYIRLFQIQAD